MTLPVHKGKFKNNKTSAKLSDFMSETYHYTSLPHACSEKIIQLGTINLQNNSFHAMCLAASA
jgi:hypothetical protein